MAAPQRWQETRFRRAWILTLGASHSASARKQLRQFRVLRNHNIRRRAEATAPTTGQSGRAGFRPINPRTQRRPPRAIGPKSHGPPVIRSFTVPPARACPGAGASRCRSGFAGPAPMECRMGEPRDRRQRTESAALAVVLASLVLSGCGLPEWAHNGFKVGPNYKVPRGAKSRRTGSTTRTRASRRRNRTSATGGASSTTPSSTRSSGRRTTRT